MGNIDRIAVHGLFGIEGLDIAWYGIIIAAGIVLGVLVAVYLAKKRGYTSELIMDMMIFALPLSIIGARLYYVAFDWQAFAGDPTKIFAIWEGGLAIYGAVIGAVLGAFILCKWRKFPFLRLLDFGGPGLILGQAIGRWGNFINQEAFGAQVIDPAMQFFPYAVHVDEIYLQGQWYYNSWFQATFFYESMWDLGLFIFLMWFFNKSKHDGTVFAWYMIGYGVGRLWIEGVRINTLTMAGGIPVSQFVSVILIILGAIRLIYVKVKNPENSIYEGMYKIGYKEQKENKAVKSK